MKRKKIIPSEIKRQQQVEKEKYNTFKILGLYFLLEIKRKLSLRSLRFLLEMEFKSRKMKGVAKDINSGGFVYS